MRILHVNLKAKGHLKHFGRLQLALFLKGIGLTVEENVAYWKAHFRKFDSGLLYNVRHIYGQEGKKRAYEPWACDKVISLRPGQGELHGCPFKTFANRNMSDLLHSYDLSEGEIKKVTYKRHIDPQRSC